MFSDIIIVGGGAAGLMAAAGALEAGKGVSVTILEKMPRPGRKIVITGKGRCNISNVKPWNEFSGHIRSKSNFLRPAFYNFPPEKLMETFKRQGLEIVVERGDRAFPASSRALDVVDTLVKRARSLGCKIETDCEVLNIEADGEKGFVLTSSKGDFSCKKLIVATGGLSYPTTGCTGDGYTWAKHLGHSLKPCFPSLTALVPKGYKAGKPENNGHIDRKLPLSESGRFLYGVNIKNVGLTLFINNNEAQNEIGDIDFTDCGLEGPAGFNISRNCVKAIINGSKTRVVVDMKPGVSEKELRERIIFLWEDIGMDERSLRLSEKEKLRILLGKLLPWNLISGFVHWNKDVFTNKKADINALVKALKHWHIDIEGYVGYERCVVTAGGVSTDEIFPKTMESRLCQGLYFCGEVLDIDADTGGYNLQAAFSTGYLAGLSAAASLKK